jgi:hypothetical protein
MVNIYSKNFCDMIETFWKKKHQGNNEQYYVFWPSEIQIKPIGVENLDATKLHYEFDGVDVGAFIVTANTLYLKGLIDWAKEIYDYRLEYKNHLQYHINFTQDDDESDFAKEQKIKYGSYNSPLRFMMKKLLRRYLSYSNFKVNINFNLIEQHQNMLDDEFLIINLKTNDNIIGVTKDYIITSSMNCLIPFSFAMLHELSFGEYVGIRHGVYMHKREGCKNWLKN